MGLQNYEDLTDVHLDVLKEVGNIGSGNASAALSNMINLNVKVEMPEVKVVDFHSCTDQSGGAEQIVAATMTRMSGGMEGMILLLMDKDFINVIVKVFYGREVEGLLSLKDEEISAITEIGNIMCGAYVSAVCQLSGIDVVLETPSFTVDMTGALMSVPVVEFGEVGDQILYIDKKLSIDGEEMNTKLFVIPTMDSLQNLLRKLGVEE